MPSNEIIEQATKNIDAFVREHDIDLRGAFNYARAVALEAERLKGLGEKTNGN